MVKSFTQFINENYDFGRASITTTHQVFNVILRNEFSLSIGEVPVSLRDSTNRWESRISGYSLSDSDMCGPVQVFSIKKEGSHHTYEPVAYGACRDEDFKMISDMVSQPRIADSSKHSTTIAVSIKAISENAIPSIFMEHKFKGTSIYEHLAHEFRLYTFFEIRLKRKATRKEGVEIKDTTKFSSLPHVKKLLELGFEMKSTPAQLKNGTLSFQLPIWAVTFKNEMYKSTFEKKKYEYITDLTVTKVGRIRRNDTMSHGPALTIYSGKPFSGPEDYENALAQTWYKLENWFKKMEANFTLRDPNTIDDARIDHHTSAAIDDLW